MKLSTAALPLAAATLVTAASAQAPNYPDFSSIAGLSLVERAAQSGNVMRVHDELAPSGPNNMGAVWFQTPVNVAGGFSTEFTFSINQNGGASSGGDGMAFVIQNELTPGITGGVGVNGIGRHASAMGYGKFVGSAAGESVDNSLAIEIDSFGNFGQPAADPINDPDGNHISIHTGGNGENSQVESFSIGRVDSITLGTNMADGMVYSVRVVYVPGTLEVYFEGTLVIQVPYDFATGGTYTDSGAPVGGLDLIGGTSAWVGFTAASGGAVENHDLHSWTWDGSGIGTNFCTATPNSSGLVGVMGASGSLDVTANDLTLEASNMPPGQFGIFIVSRDQGFVPGVGGASNGNLCLSGSIGRYRQGSQIQSTGTTGAFDLQISLATIPQGNGTVAAQAGETWNFQAWFRDGVGQGSNLTDGLTVTFN